MFWFPHESFRLCLDFLISSADCSLLLWLLSGTVFQKSLCDFDLSDSKYAPLYHFIEVLFIGFKYSWLNKQMFVCVSRWQIPGQDERTRGPVFSHCCFPQLCAVSWLCHIEFVFIRGFVCFLLMKLSTWRYYFWENWKRVFIWDLCVCVYSDIGSPSVVQPSLLLHRVAQAGLELNNTSIFTSCEYWDFRHERLCST